jgi:hypothetical protein
VIEHHLEQRGAVQAALGLQGIDQVLERQVLVGLGREHALAHLGQHLDEAVAAIGSLQHLGVDEEADQPSTSARVRLAIGVPTRITSLALCASAAPARSPAAP